MISPTPAEKLPGLVRALLAGRPGTRWVGVDGLGASGKTTLAARVVAALPGAVVVHVDDFARPGTPGWDPVRSAGWEYARFVTQVLEPLQAGRSARYRGWDHTRTAPGPWRQVPTGVPVVVEGVAATDARTGVPWDVTVWLDVTEDERRRRILARDAPDVLELWRRAWWPSELAYVAGQNPAGRADVVVWSGPGSRPTLPS